MGLLSNIEIALGSRLNTLSGLPDVAWPNTYYKPSKGTTWIRPTLLSASGSSNTFGGKDRQLGVYQIDIFIPLDTGLKTMYDLADSIKDHFDKQILTEGGNKIYIDVISFTNYERSESWFMGSVEINYFCIED